MKWLHQWRLNRAERALEAARERLAACQVACAQTTLNYCDNLDNLIHAEAAERELVTAVKDLRRKLGMSLVPTQCSKCGPSCQCDIAWNE